MLFNSLEFAVFFPVVTLLYYVLPQRWRWLMLLLASCAFYMAFVPVYILILLVTIVIDYAAGIYIADHPGRGKRPMLVLSIVSTCLVLFVFKYFNFFNWNARHLAHLIGWNYPISALELLLPIGLSFHTFQSLSYVIEVYRGHQKPERHFGIYALYVMFYPQLVAGPIERPQNLLHQFRERHSFDYEQFTSGIRLMAWGFFKKLVIADRLAPYVNGVYNNPQEYSGAVLALATLAFAYQIFCDFSGYSDIALGTARCMGFKLMQNFNAPYHAQSIAEFWKRWHISLSTWFRDYVYIPLGGNRVSRPRWALNIVAVFALSGLWHGANWTYIIWGALNGVYIVCGAAWDALKARLFQHSPYSNTLPIPTLARFQHSPDSNSAVVVITRVLFTFLLTCVAWVFFRANTLPDAIHVLGHFHVSSPVSLMSVPGANVFGLGIGFAGVVLLECVQVLERRGFSFEPKILALPLPLRWVVYYTFIFAIILLGAYDQRQFIYFQF